MSILTCIDNDDINMEGRELVQGYSENLKTYT